MSDEYFRVSYSSLNSFEGCARLFEFNKLYPRTTPRPNFFSGETGHALHAGHQEFMSSQDEQLAYWAMINRFPFEMELEENDSSRSAEACINTLELMLECEEMKRYELAEIENHRGEVVPAVEVPFELRFDKHVLPDGRKLAFTGWIDEILRDRFTGTYASCDIKTTRMTTKDLDAKYRFDSQQIPYGMVVDHISGGKVEEFTVQYLHCFIDVSEPQVQLLPYKKTQEDLQEWLMNRSMQMERICRYAAMDYFPRTEAGCLRFFKPCSYLDVCQSRSRPDIMQWFLMGQEPHVEEDDWNPWIVGNVEV